MRLYHGTAAPFANLAPHCDVWGFPAGIFLSPCRQLAAQFAAHRADDIGDGAAPRIYVCDVDTTDACDVDAYVWEAGLLLDGTESVLQALADSAYDATRHRVIILPDMTGSEEPEYLVTGLSALTVVAVEPLA